MKIYGSISHGTMRAEDIIPEFASVLKELDTEGKYDDLISEAQNIEDYNSDEADYILEDLSNALDYYAPEGHYFGAHIGDGSDYGFWEDDITEGEYSDYFPRTIK